MTKRALPCFVFVALDLVGACSDESSPLPAAEFGCQDPMDPGFCTQFLLADEGDLEATQESCSLGGIREVIDSCPATDVVGCCVLQTPQYVAHQCYYPPTTTQMVEDQCETLGQAFEPSP